MGNFDKGNRSGGRGGNRDSGGRGGNRGGGKSFGGGGDRNRGGGRGNDRPEMHSATCAECSKRCEVPFRPSGDKPVYCSDCYKSQGGGDKNSRDMGGRRDYNKGNDRPRYDNKPAYRNDKQDGGADKELLQKINFKLDKILKIISSNTQTEIAEPMRNTKERDVYKKEVDTAALKDVLTQTLKTEKKGKSKKTATIKKNVEKKAVVKKSTKKKTTTKKTPAKKESAKKTTAKKITKKKK